MPQLIKHGQVAVDTFTVLSDELPLPAASVIVSLVRWKNERESLREHGFPIGIVLANTDDVAELATDLPRIPLVVLQFPAFPDGRAYSQARLLRDRYGYAGELRATGAVVVDQLPEMTRCGFDAIELADGVDVAAALKLTKTVSVRYQEWV